MKSINLIILCLLTTLNLSAQEFLQSRNNFKIENWKFHKGDILGADAAGEASGDKWTSVTVPHTWNAEDVFTQGSSYYQGVGWYRSTFTVEQTKKESRFFIRFEGVSMVADVFLNGTYIGSHKGGYSAFIFEVTDLVKNGRANYLAVKADNSTQVDVAPSATTLYPLFGGIYRPVTIFSTSDVNISPLDYASSGVYISPKNITKEKASIEVKTLLNNSPANIVKTQSNELRPPKGQEGQGLLGQYFDNPNFAEQPTLTRVDKEVFFDYAFSAPHEKLPKDGFSMIWTGRFKPNTSGTYKFFLESDDGSRLYIDNKQVLDLWGVHAAFEKTYSTDLKAGEEVDIKIEYNELAGPGSIKFGYVLLKPENQRSKGNIITEILDDNNVVIASAEKNYTLKNDEKQTVLQNLSISKPHLWQGKSDPYLYTLRTTLKDEDNRILDQVEQPLGLRYFEVDRDKGLILNDKAYPLYGVSRHQEWEGYGPALSEEQHRTDFDLMKELGVTSIRFAHYQQADIMYDLSDKNGMVVWAEIPNTPKYRNTPEYLANCKLQLTELIKQNYNHPSIFFWGLYNEIDIPAEDVQALHDTAKKLDPNRFTTQADFVQPQKRHTITDVVAWNWYFGWYYDSFDKYPDWYDDLHEEYPNLKAGLSEYGASASINHQELNPERPDPNSGRFFPEQYQTLYHEEVWKGIKDRDDIWCKYIWNMFDFSWTTAIRGDKPYRNYKGLMTHDRKMKKDAFYFYKANWSEAPVIYIKNKRLSKRDNAKTVIEVYTNLEEVELFVNGKLISKRTMDSEIHKIKWENVQLVGGKNRIDVIGRNGNQLYTDSCEWNYMD